MLLDFRTISSVLLWPFAVLCSGAGSDTEQSTSSLTSIPADLTALPSNSGVDYSNYASPSSIIDTAYTATGYSSTYTATINNTITSIRSNATTSTSALATISSASQISISGSASASASAVSTGDFVARCNGYAELCDRKYSNVTYVMAHNSPFVVPDNAASNQAFHVTTQLNDGIRGLQFETHKPNASSPMMLCHSSCDELNVGPLEDYLVTVREWLDEHRYQVITIAMGNDDFVDPGNYTQPFVDSGMIDYIYVPESAPMGISGWPTLGEMILTNKRVVVMLDYDANQSEIPWLLEQWNYLFQTPFSPTNPEFPCTVQRPPDQPRHISMDRLYTANHNLNLPIDITTIGLDILVPDWPKLSNTNANFTTVEGAAGTMVENCTAMWGRPPTFLLVDYYNYGNFNGSTLAVGAAANNVTYYPDSCCGLAEPYTAAAARGRGFEPVTLVLMAAALAAAFIVCN